MIRVRSPVSKNYQTPTLEHKRPLVLLPCGKSQWFKSPVPGTGSRDKHIYFFLLSHSWTPGLWPQSPYSKMTPKSKDTGSLLEPHAVINTYPVHHHIVGKCLPAQGRSGEPGSTRSRPKSKSGFSKHMASRFQASGIMS